MLFHPLATVGLNTPSRPARHHIKAMEVAVHKDLEFLPQLLYLGKGSRCRLALQIIILGEVVLGPLKRSCFIQRSCVPGVKEALLPIMNLPGDFQYGERSNASPLEGDNSFPCAHQLVLRWCQL